MPSIAPYVLPAVLPRLRKRHGELRVRLREALTADPVDATRRGDLDLLLLSLDAPLGGLIERELFVDPFVIALPRGHRLATRKVLVPFRDPPPGRRIGLAWRATSPRAAEYETLAAFFTS